MKCNKVILFSIFSLFVWGFLYGIAAQTAICINQANGVPALNGAPIWWDKDGDGNFPEAPDPSGYAEIDSISDPRWRNAAGIGHGSGTVEEAGFRALYRTEAGQTFLYLSWHVKADQALNDNLDMFFVGFSPGIGGEDVLFQITPYSSSTTLPKKAVLPGEVDAFTSSDGGLNWNLWNSGNEPAWSAATTRIWLLQTSTSPSNYEWAVQMQIPVTSSTNLDDGLNLGNIGDSFKMWYEMQVHNSGGAFVQYNWPNSQSIVYSGLGDPSYPTVNFWESFCIGNCSGASGFSCETGVSLAANKIGTNNTDGIGNPTPHRIDLNDPNVFFARPMNNTGGNIAIGALKATFRWANWGSLPDWNDVPDPLTLWNEIPATGGPSATNAAAITNGTEGLIELSPWTLNDCERVDFNTDPYPGICNEGTDPNRYKKRTHQCILVELEGPFVFENRSVYRNMDFADASKFTRTAEISVKGLGADALNRPKRDVYLYVQTFNMPAEIPQINQDEEKKDPKKQEIVTHQRRDKDPSFGDIAKKMPTMIIYVFHDTGERKVVDGVKYPKLRAQSSFGYFVRHENDNLTGWVQELQGATEIGPNLYKIGIENDGVAVIQTEIEAKESCFIKNCCGTYAAEIDTNNPERDRVATISINVFLIFVLPFIFVEIRKKFNRK